MGSSSLRRPYRETTTTFYRSQPTTTQVVSSLHQDVIRETRSTPPFPVSISSSTTESTNLNKSDANSLKFLTGELSAMDGKIVAVHVTSSSDEKIVRIGKDKTKRQPVGIGDRGAAASTFRTIKTSPKNLVSSEERPSIVAEASKSDFAVDEGEPITSNADMEYPANIRQLPSPKQLPSYDTSELIAQHLARENIKDNLQPYHETVIFHNHPRDSTRARSVSYSSVIQSIPNQKVWNIDQKTYEELNKYQEEPTFPKHNQTNPDEKNYYHPSDFNESVKKPARSKEENWEKPEESPKHQEPTERNWAEPEKQFKVYAQPEQNYEVDEAVSVMSNGRVHGVQPITETHEEFDAVKSDKKQKKTDDNQKVGYVVEGRNYRKYRVEERTSDGFIVGEYGVVNHDNGSLRGVRYTADGTTSPRLIYDALMKFLSL